MTKKPVTAKRKLIAREFGLVNVTAAALACRQVGIPFYVACALLEKESRGKNIYGHDQGGIFSRDEHREVTDQNFLQFFHQVVLLGETSNGVGPCQITYAGQRMSTGRRDGGYFREMFDAGLRPWVPYDNMIKGFLILKGHYDAKGSWSEAGDRYNGADAYGDDLAKKIGQWKSRLKA